MVVTHEFEVFFGHQSFVRVQMSLEFDVNEARGVIIEKTSARIQLTVETPSCGCEESALRAAHKMIDRNLLSWNQVSIFQNTFAITYCRTDSSRRWSTMLFAILAGSTIW
jgi:hypothetical protein